MDELRQLLDQCNVPPDIVQNFISNGITADIFVKLSPDNLKELCPHLCSRIKLNEIITAYINIDFELKYPDSGAKFYLYFNEFFNKLLQLRKTKNETAKYCASYTRSGRRQENTCPNPCNDSFDSTSKGRLNKNVKFSSQEALDSTFVLVTNAGDIDTKIDEQKQKAAANKLPVQSYIVLQGTLLSCSTPLLVIDNIKYTFNNISQAFDTLFKAYHGFDASYPLSSNHIHHIIQRCVYKIQTKHDNVVPYILDVLQL